MHDARDAYAKRANSYAKIPFGAWFTRFYVAVFACGERAHNAGPLFAHAANRLLVSQFLGSHPAGIAGHISLCPNVDPIDKALRDDCRKGFYPNLSTTLQQRIDVIRFHGGSHGPSPFVSSAVEKC
jgi:hypothetical protein